MGKRKWKAKKAEKQQRKADQDHPKQESKVERGKAKKRKLDDDSPKHHKDIDKILTMNEHITPDDEMETTRKLKTEKNKKKSGGFQSMGLSFNVLKGITRRGYRIPTPIQRKTIPLILEGKDVVAMARTGSGKTAAFLVPMFERLKAHTSSGTRAIVMAPTRELALQTLKFAKEIGKFVGLKAAVILGGDRMDDQFSALHGNPDLIIATPGRFLHVLIEMEMRLKSVEYVVFDEADRLFEMGFESQLQEVIHRLPDSRQTLLFSATLPKSLVDFAKAGLTDPVLIRLDVDSKLSENLTLTFLSCRELDKLALLLYLLKYVIKPREQTVVFAATKHHVEFLYQLLTTCGLYCTYIYSSLDQTARKINAAKFSLGKVRVLIVTDLAARGIDVPLLDNVINFNFPAKPKLFVHRVGRVARAGRCGTAYSLVCSDEMAHLVDLHVFLGRPLKTVAVGERPQDVDGCLGEVPQSLLDDEDSGIRQTIKGSVELTGLEKTCNNGYRKYIKSRPPASSESIKRVKQMAIDGQTLGMHPLFGDLSSEEQGTRLDMLNALKSYKPKNTVFEINSTSKKTGFEVMKAKRDQHQHIIAHNTAKMAEREEEQRAQKQASDLNPTPSGSSKGFNRRKRTKTDEADQDEINAVFGKVVTSRDSVKKALASETEVKDKENYIEYRPSDYASEKGLSIKSNFEKEASGAVLDFVSEEQGEVNQKKRKWDRKRKKFVSETGDETKKKKLIKTESGNWISASYKSHAYADWQKRNHKGGLNDGTPQREEARRHTGLKVVGLGKRNFHTHGRDKDVDKDSGNRKQKFKKREMKSAETILKNRKRQSKVENFQKHRQNMRSKRKGKDTGGKGKRK